MKDMKKKAQSLIEYGLILALVAVIAVTVLGKFGGTITNVGENTNTAVNNASKNSMEAYCTSIKCTYNAEKGLCSCPPPPANP